MDSRFTLKDAVFVLLFIVVIGAVVFAGWMFHYQELRLTAVQQTVSQLGDVQKQQLATLSRMEILLRSGVRVSATGEGSGAGTQASTQVAGVIRRTEADGSQYVYYPEVPDSPRQPDKRPDYAYGDWLVQNLGMEPGKVTPFVAEDDMSGAMADGPVLESLVAQDPQTEEWFPYLSDWYRVSADGLRLTFHLRKGVCFSDGKPMTAEDVLFSFNTVMNKDVDCAPLRSYYDKVKSCRKIDERTVEFTMKEPYFLALEFVGGLSIIPEHVYKFTTGEEYNQRSSLLVGSGPYRLEKWERGQQMVYVRNEKYWGDRPTFDRLVYRFISNAQAQLQSFLNEQLDYVGEPIQPDPEIYLQYSQDPSFQKKFIAYKYSQPAAMYMYLGWNCDRPMFQDKQTRRALTMLVDRRAIIEQMLKGFGAEMTGPFNPRSKQNDSTIKALPYDPAGAKAMLAAAGWRAGADGVLERDGTKFEFNLSLRTGVPIREQIATYVQQQFQQAGIRVHLTPYESSVLLDHLNKREFDAVLAGWGGGGVESDPKQIWSSESIANAGSNHVGFRNAEADKLIAEGERTIDEEKRMEIWHQFQKIVYDEQPYTWLYSEQDCAFINGRFKNTEPYPTGLSPLDWYVPAVEQKYR
ncbi:MAG TPA: ABC transporter substrate-binding protein [Phycisphaerae bacterium]|nr:ABC transporter substrate-binding protein [Phycisphaerae bacterium]